MTAASIRVRACGAAVRDGAVLLVAYEDAEGLHYNLPGGGVEPGESLRDAVRREMREEACADVSVGRLVLVYEYVPSQWGHAPGTRPQVGLVFLCALRDGCEPRQPDDSDPNAHPPQVGVAWIPLDDLDTEPLIPHFPDFAVRLRSAMRDTGADTFCADWAIPGEVHGGSDTQ